MNIQKVNDKPDRFWYPVLFRCLETAWKQDVTVYGNLRINEV